MFRYIPLVFKEPKLFGAWFGILLGNRLTSHGPGTASVGKFKTHYLSRSHFYALFHDIYLDKTYFLPEDLSPRTILDCGANIGMSMLYFKSRWPNASITCFEPNPESLTCLKENITKNNLKEVRIEACALGKSEGEAELYIDPKIPGSTSASLVKNFMMKAQDLPSIKVPVRRLSSFVQDRIDLVKIDIEGFEGDVLEELAETGAIAKINSFYIEYHYDGTKTKYSLGSILHLLDSADFDYVLKSSSTYPLYRTTPKRHAEIIFAWKK